MFVLHLERAFIKIMWYFGWERNNLDKNLCLKSTKIVRELLSKSNS